MNDMGKKEKQIYPRSGKEMLRIMKAADKKGQLLEAVLEEFARHPFSMPALWDCRDYIFSIKREDYVSNPVLITHLTLLSSMAGRLVSARLPLFCTIFSHQVPGSSSQYNCDQVLPPVQNP